MDCEVDECAAREIGTYFDDEGCKVPMSKFVASWIPDGTVYGLTGGARYKKFVTVCEECESKFKLRCTVCRQGMIDPWIHDEAIAQIKAVLGDRLRMPSTPICRMCLDHEHMPEFARLDVEQYRSVIGYYRRIWIDRFKKGDQFYLQKFRIPNHEQWIEQVRTHIAQTLYEGMRKAKKLRTQRQEAEKQEEEKRRKMVAKYFLITVQGLTLEDCEKLTSILEPKCIERMSKKFGDHPVKYLHNLIEHSD